MDMNQLLFQHQLALMNAGDDRPGMKRDVRFDRARRYASKIESLRRELGAREYPVIDPSCAPVADA